MLSSRRHLDLISLPYNVISNFQNFHSRNNLKVKKEIRGRVTKQMVENLDSLAMLEP